jgi:hypothetical protein
MKAHNEMEDIYRFNDENVNYLIGEMTAVRSSYRDFFAILEGPYPIHDC